MSEREILKDTLCQIQKNMKKSNVNLELMKKCQVGVGNYKGALDDANNLLAECYGVIGKLMSDQHEVEVKAVTDFVKAYERQKFGGDDGVWFYLIRYLKELEHGKGE